MSLNKISAEIPREQEDQIIQAIDGLSNGLDFLVDVDDETRLRMLLFSPLRQSFIDRILVHAENLPEVWPGYIELAEYKKDVMLAQSLYRVFATTNAFNKKLKDTLMVVQGEAYEIALAFYNSLKEAAKHRVPGAEAVAKELSFHFRRKSGTKKKDEAEKNAEKSAALKNGSGKKAAGRKRSAKNNGDRADIPVVEPTEYIAPQLASGEAG